MKRTEWIEYNQAKPAYAGWYEVKDSDSEGLYHSGAWEIAKVVKRYWNGIHWEWKNPDEGMHLASNPTHWRGLVNP